MLVGILGPGLWTLDDASCGWGNGREVWAAFSYVEDLSLGGASIYWLTFLAGKTVPYSHGPRN